MLQNVRIKEGTTSRHKGQEDLSHLSVVSFILSYCAYFVFKNPIFISTCRKKLSKFSQNPNWQNASNYVAKHYKKEVPRETYYDDVKLQMDSKLWGEEYSKLNIPKKV